MRLTIFRWLSVCSLLFICLPVCAKDEIKIGILAYRAKDSVAAQWQPLAHALNKALPDCNFAIEAYDYDELLAAVSSRQIDFVLTNPGSYLLMAHRSGLTAPLVTLANLHQGKRTSAMGGVIFTRADRHDINKLQDLREHRVAITSMSSLSGYEMQIYELLHGGVHFNKDLQLSVLGLPQDKVVEAVMNRSADVGFVRSGLIETMADAGRLDIEQIKIINRQDLPGFPVAVSTRLYPEWPLAALPQTNRDLQRKLAAYLLTLADHHDLTKALRISGFDVPADYSSVETVLRELRMPPFDAGPEFTAEDIWLQYRWQSSMGLCALTLIALLGFNLYRSNRRLRNERQIVLEQTAQLKSSNKLLDSIIDNIPVMIYLKRASDLRYVLINRYGENLLGRYREEVTEHNDEELFEPAQAKNSVHDDKRALRSNEAIDNPEEHIQSANGPRILHSKKLVLRDEQRNPLYLLGISEDITDRIRYNRQMQELNDHLAATLQAIPDLLFELDKHGTYLNIWTQDANQLHMQKETLLGHTVKEMLPNAAALTIMAALTEAHLNGHSRGRVMQLKFAEQTHWFELSVSSKSTKNEEPRFIVLSRDITEGKLAAQTLSHNEERLRLALGAARQGWYDVNVQTGEILVSPEYTKMLGYDPETFHTDMDNWVAHIHEDDREALLSVFRDCLVSGEPRTMQYRRRNAAGSWLWISSVGQVTEWDAQHQPLRVVGIHTDISERKEAEAALQHANRTLAILSAVNRNLVHATDEKRLLESVCQTIVDQSAYRMSWVGYLQHDAKRSILPVAQVGSEQGYLETAGIVWADVARGRGTTGRAARSGRVQISQDIVNDPSMVPWHQEAEQRGFKSCISLPLAQQGNVFGVLVIYADQTDAFSPADVALLTEMSNDLAFGVKSLQARHERDIALEALSVTALQLERANEQIEEERVMLAKRVEERTAQLSMANKAKDAFLATMSHEIRTPLGGLLGMMELLHLSHMDDKQKNMLEVARLSGKSLLRIVDDILDWSKIEAGKLAIVPSTGSLRETLHLIRETYSESAEGKGISLQVEVDPRLGTAHRYDTIRIAQILHNFTSNALKFTQMGSIVISATQVSRQADSETIRLCVQDSGIGISASQIKRLFEQYEQASEDTARMYGGTGLGLAICRSLASLMQGELSVESKLGYGSTFCLTITLPIATSLPQPDAEVAVTSPENTPDTYGTLSLQERRIKVLLVDDQPVNRMLLKQQLELFDIAVEAAADGAEALALWQEEEYDLIISDCHMPEMDGYEFTRNVREQEFSSGRQRTPIIAWTANVLSDEWGRSLGAGMDDMLTKPTELHTLHAMLMKWLPFAVSTQHLSTAVEQSPSGVENAVMDFTVLRKYARDREAQLALLQAFLTHNREDLAELSAAVQGGECEPIARAAHRIKGAARMIGALALQALCADMERAAQAGELEQARILAGPPLRNTVEETETAISRYLRDV